MIDGVWVYTERRSRKQKGKLKKDRSKAVGKDMPAEMIC